MKLNVIFTCSHRIGSMHHASNIMRPSRTTLYCGGIVSNNTGHVDNELTLSGLTHATAIPGELKDAQDMARERVLACAFLLGNDHA
jgi:hypothetical protein